MNFYDMCDRCHLPSLIRKGFIVFIYSASKQLQPKSSKSRTWKLYRYVVNNIQLTVFLAIYLNLNVVFLTQRAYYHYSIGENGFYIVGKIILSVCLFFIYRV